MLQEKQEEQEIAVVGTKQQQQPETELTAGVLKKKSKNTQKVKKNAFLIKQTKTGCKYKKRICDPRL